MHPALLRRRALLCWPAALALPAQAQPAPEPVPPELRGLWPGAQRHGATRFRWLGLAVYDIALWLPSAATDPNVLGRALAQGQQPLALSLQYHLALESGRIAERSVLEMSRAGPLPEAQAQRWRQALAAVLPDVASADRLTGVFNPGQGLVFHHNGQRRGELADAELAQRFVGIWLSPWTSEPGLRRQLLGAAA